MVEQPRSPPEGRDESCPGRSFLGRLVGRGHRMVPNVEPWYPAPHWVGRWCVLCGHVESRYPEVKRVVG